MKSRLELFHIVFSHFTILQIIKSSKQLVSIQSGIFLALLSLSFLWIQFFHGSISPVATITMCTSFIALSLIDGSLSNHVVTSSCLSLVVLSCFNSSQKVWETQTRRAVIWFTAILYLVTGLHKLNDGFFDPHYSCASLYVSGAASWIPLKILEIDIVHALVSFLVRSAPTVAVMFELGIPIPLVLSLYWDTRRKLIIRTALLIGSTFHAILALPPSPLSVYPFSSIMVPMYILMVPRQCDGIDRFVQWFSLKKFAVIAPLIVLAAMHASYFIFGEDELFEYPNYGLWAVSVFWNIVAWCVILMSMCDHRLIPEPESTGSMRKLTRFSLVGLFLFGMTPYIGLRNYPALAMFSNLRTEGARPNHWMPAWDLFGYQTDVVDVVATNIPEIRDMEINLGHLFPQKLKDTNNILGLSNEFYICPPKWPYDNPDKVKSGFSAPWVELRRRFNLLERADLNDDSFIKYIRTRPGGKYREVHLSGPDLWSNPELWAPLGWFEKTFVKFRSFSDRYSPCRH